MQNRVPEMVMGWEKRGRESYYYRPVRLNGKPRRVYLGHGAFGRTHAILDRQEARARVARREAHKQLVALVRQIRDLGRKVNVLGRAVLLATGWYQNRGTWRILTMFDAVTEETAHTPPPSEGSLDEQLDDLVEAVRAKEPGATDELRAFLDQHPEMASDLADPAQTNLAATAKLLAGDNVVEFEAILARSRHWHTTMLGDDPRPVLHVLVEHLACVRLMVMYAERRTRTHLYHDNDTPHAARQYREMSKSLRDGIALYDRLTTPVNASRVRRPVRPSAKTATTDGTTRSPASVTAKTEKGIGQHI